MRREKQTLFTLIIGWIEAHPRTETFHIKRQTPQKLDRQSPQEKGATLPAPSGRASPCDLKNGLHQPMRGMAATWFRQGQARSLDTGAIVLPDTPAVASALAEVRASAGGDAGSLIVGRRIQLGSSGAATGEPIKVGSIQSKTGPDDFSSSGQGAKAFFECVNANGGITLPTLTSTLLSTNSSGAAQSTTVSAPLSLSKAAEAGTIKRV